MDELLKIAISSPIPVPWESNRITSLLALGWDRVHLRYPTLTVNQVADIIKVVPEEFHPRLRLHGQFELTDRFNIGGLQLNSRCPEPLPASPALFQKAATQLRRLSRPSATDALTALR